MSQKGLVEINENSALAVRFTYDGLEELIQEIARGDFTGDGSEDILVSITIRDVQGGSYFSHNLSILTRDSSGQTVFQTSRPTNL